MLPTSDINTPQRALAGVAVTNDATNDSANDAPTKASATTTTLKSLVANGDEVDALSHFGVTGVLCNRVIRKIRDIAERQFYGPRQHCDIHR